MQALHALEVLLEGRDLDAAAAWALLLLVLLARRHGAAAAVRRRLRGQRSLGLV